jgi:hypothetical protein
MGFVSTEQTVAIIEAVGEAIPETAPVVMRSEPNMNFWPLLWLAVIPVILGWWLNKRKKK